jgi:hypothetical protein
MELGTEMGVEKRLESKESLNIIRIKTDKNNAVQYHALSKRYLFNPSYTCSTGLHIYVLQIITRILTKVNTASAV